MVDAVTFLQGLGLPQILLWLLTFAVINGILNQTNALGSRFARGIVSIVVAFLVILSAPVSLIGTIAKMSSSIVLVLVGVLLLAVFFEVAGVHGTVKVKQKVKNKEGKDEIKEGLLVVPIFQAHGKLFAVAFLIIAALIFANSGGLGLLGLQGIQIGGQGATSIAFFMLVLLAVVWMIAEKK